MAHEIEIEVEDQHGNAIPFDLRKGCNVTVIIDTRDKEVFASLREEIRKEVVNEVTQALFTNISKENKTWTL